MLYKLKYIIVVYYYVYYYIDKCKYIFSLLNLLL